MLSSESKKARLAHVVGSVCPQLDIIACLTAMGTAPESRDSIPKTEKLLRALCMSSFKAQEISASRQPS